MEVRLDFYRPLPDLLDNARGTRNRYQMITTKYIIDHYKAQGIKKLVIFDFSCGVFQIQNFQNKVDARTSRKMRRRLTNYGGSKRRKRKTKTKRRY